MDEFEFQSYLEQSYASLREKQLQLIEEYHLGDYSRYAFDQQRGIIQFSNDEHDIYFKAIFIGTWSDKSQTWMWAWANPSLLSCTRAHSAALKRLAFITKNTDFYHEVIPGSEVIAHAMTSVAVDYLNAMGMYISPEGQNKVFMAIMHPEEKEKLALE